MLTSFLNAGPLLWPPGGATFVPFNSPATSSCKQVWKSLVSAGLAGESSLTALSSHSLIWALETVIEAFLEPEPFVSWGRFPLRTKIISCASTSRSSTLQSFSPSATPHLGKKINIWGRHRLQRNKTIKWPVLLTSGRMSGAQLRWVLIFEAFCCFSSFKVTNQPLLFMGRTKLHQEPINVWLPASWNTL